MPNNPHVRLYLNVSVQVSELVHVCQSLDASPRVVREEVHWTHYIQHDRIAEQEVQFCLINPVASEENLAKQELRYETVTLKRSTHVQF